MFQETAFRLVVSGSDSHHPAWPGDCPTDPRGRRLMNAEPKSAWLDPFNPLDLKIPAGIATQLAWRSHPSDANLTYLWLASRSMPGTQDFDPVGPDRVHDNHGKFDKRANV